MNAVRVASPQYLLLRRKEKYYLYFSSLPLRLSAPSDIAGTLTGTTRSYARPPSRRDPNG
jgi:hypothetical protein